MADDQTGVFRALADPTRRQILTDLRAGELAAGEIAARFPISGPSISRHLSVLKGAGLVTERREANRIYYSLVEERLAICVGNFLSTVCPEQVVMRRKRHKAARVGQSDADPPLPVPAPPGVELPTAVMRIAITGGSGFVGGHLAEALSAGGHEAVVLARGVDQRPRAQEVLGLPRVSLAQVGIGDERGLVKAFQGCDAVAHCAGINREVGSQTYEAVHVRGTTNVVRAAEEAGVRRVVIVSFLRARPDCGSPYHESKWAAEEIIRASSCEWTVLKPGMMFGRGDHMLDHLSHALYTFPVFLGIGARRVRPLAVADAVEVLMAALVEGRLANQTVGLVGPAEIGFDDAAHLVADAIGKHPLFVAAPLAFHYLLVLAAEHSMTVPLIALAQVRILKEEVVEPARAPDHLPDDLTPSTPFDHESIRAGLPDPGPFGLTDLRWFSRPDGGDGQGFILVYDGDCGFCTTAARWAARKFSHGEQAEAWQFLGEGLLEQNRLSFHDVQEAAWWVDGRGLRERGHRAVGRALLAGGGLRRMVGWLVLTPPTSWLAAGVYRLVVRWRYRLPGGTPACRVDTRSPKV